MPFKLSPQQEPSPSTPPSYPVISSLAENEEELDHLENKNILFSQIKTRLILHLDINETILLGDESGGDSRHDSVNKMLAKSAFCQLPTTSAAKTTTREWDETQQVEPTHWWDGQEIGKETSIPPLYTGWTWPHQCCPYYRTKYKSVSNTFIEHHGRIYQGLLDQCERKLAESSFMEGSHILPALYQTLHHLIINKDQQPCTVVFRTFGSDLQEVAEAVTQFAKGKHPAFAHVHHPEFHLGPDCLFQGRWKETLEYDGRVSKIYQLWNSEETNLIASGDQEILQLLDQIPICGIRDDYPYWAGHDWDPTAGKPVWVPYYRPDQQVYDHHILFDDNIHNLPNDGIACVREQQADGSFVVVDGATMHERYQGYNLVRTPTIEPILNPNWFLEQVEKCRRRLIHRLLTKEDTAE